MLLILASNSPRRKELLSLGGWDFKVLTAPVDESVRPGEQPAAYVSRLAETKARAAQELLTFPISAGTFIIGADTAVVDGEEDDARSIPANILGKPADAQEAAAMLRRLRGRTHQVYTGLAVLRPEDGFLARAVCVTHVTMRLYSDEEVADYVASGDPMDKAGAYAIQHTGFNPVRNLHGCYANVMGLPVCSLADALAGFGIISAVDIISGCQEALDVPCPVFQRVHSPGYNLVV